MKYAQNALIAMVRHKRAIDCNDYTAADWNAVISRERYITRVGYSTNGGLWQGYRTGTLYAVTSVRDAVFVPDGYIITSIRKGV